MKKGIFIPAGVVRLAASAAALAVCAALLAEAPEIWRYYKMKRM